MPSLTVPQPTDGSGEGVVGQSLGALRMFCQSKARIVWWKVYVSALSSASIVFVVTHSLYVLCVGGVSGAVSVLDAPDGTAIVSGSWKRIDE